MPSADELKRLVFGEIDSRADEIINISQTILSNPEPGFRETRLRNWWRTNSPSWAFLSARDWL